MVKIYQIKMRGIFLLAILFFGLNSCKKEDPETQAAKDKKIIEEYIADKGLNAQTTESGLYYVIINQGSGSRPTIDSTVTVKYKGFLSDESVFDEATTPVTFSLRNVIAGWQEGIPLINEGGKITLLIPSRLGYKDQAVGSIPAYSVLIFDVELLEVN